MENNHETTACYPAPENTLPSTRKHETHQQKPFCQAPESMLPYIIEESLSCFFWTASTHGTVGGKGCYQASENILLDKRKQCTKPLSREYQTIDNLKRHIRKHVTKHQAQKHVTKHQKT